MKLYYLSIPIIIGIIIGGVLSGFMIDSNDSKKITSSKLIENGSPIMGSHNAPITILEWGDYQCTFCYKFHQNTLDIINEDFIKTGKVKIVFKDFPLNGFDSKLAAEASYCADEQNKYWLYHDIVFKNWAGENTGWVNMNSLVDFAIQADLDIPEFRNCLNEHKYYQKVIDNENYAKQIGINATPTFLIFDDNELIRIIGAQQLDKFQNALNQLG